jgi:hypothetical protein
LICLSDLFKSLQWETGSGHARENEGAGTILN